MVHTRLLLVQVLHNRSCYILHSFWYSWYSGM